MEKISEVLIKARKLIEDPAHWTQRSFARDSYGNKLGPLSESATCFCSIGALHNVQPELWLTGETSIPAKDFLNDLCKDLHGIRVVNYNDSHTHKEVLALFDAAILKAQNEQS